MVYIYSRSAIILVVKIQTFFKLWRALISNLGVKRDTTRIKIPVAIFMFFKKLEDNVEVSFLTQTMA
jgi:hypothetical protein